MGNDDDDNLTDDQLLAMPTDALPGDLSRLWAVRANAIHNREFNGMIAELTGTSGSHRMIFPDQDPIAKRQREEEAARRAAQEQQEYMDRSDRLLARIDEQERVLAKRRQEIEDKAIKLHDGCRVYVDGNNYRDENGRLLTGIDRDEADALHRGNPDGEIFKWVRSIIDNWREDSDYRKSAEELMARAIQRLGGVTFEGDIKTNHRQIHYNILTSEGIEPTEDRVPRPAGWTFYDEPS